MDCPTEFPDLKRQTGGMTQYLGGGDDTIMVVMSMVDAKRLRGLRMDLARILLLH